MNFPHSPYGPCLVYGSAERGEEREQHTEDPRHQAVLGGSRELREQAHLGLSLGGHGCYEFQDLPGKPVA